MPIFKGSVPIASIYKGATAMSRVYHGDTLVFDKAADIEGVPLNLSAPVILGSRSELSLLKVTNGTWAGVPTSFSYQWYREGTPVSGATSQWFLTTRADEDDGNDIHCVVTATNSFGGTPANSDTATIAAESEVTTSVAFQSQYTNTADLGSSGFWSFPDCDVGAPDDRRTILILTYTGYNYENEGVPRIRVNGSENNTYFYYVEGKGVLNNRKVSLGAFQLGTDDTTVDIEVGRTNAASTAQFCGMRIFRAIGLRLESQIWMETSHGRTTSGAYTLDMPWPAHMIGGILDNRFMSSSLGTASAGDPGVSVTHDNAGGSFSGLTAAPATATQIDTTGNTSDISALFSFKRVV